MLRRRNIFHFFPLEYCNDRPVGSSMQNWTRGVGVSTTYMHRIKLLHNLVHFWLSSLQEDMLSPPPPPREILTFHIISVSNRCLEKFSRIFSVCRPAAVKCTGAWAKLFKTLVFYQRQKNPSPMFVKSSALKISC